MAEAGSLDTMKTVLVTGGAGYVGSILVRRLLQNGFRVVCVDCLRFGGRSLTEVWDHPNFTFRKIDITDSSRVDEVFKDFSFYAVVHLAAIVGDPACKKNPDLAVKTNRDASIYLLEKVKESRTRRFIFASTCSNYGKMQESNGWVDETSPLAPVSLYAELKVDVENKLLNGTPRDERFCPTILRFSTVFGISPRMRFDLTVNEFTKEIALGKELVVFGEQFWRPYCHVSDYSDAVLNVLLAPPEKVAYEVFNVGDSGQNYTKKMIVDELLKQVPEGIVKYVHREEDPRDYRVNFEKIKSVLGFHISKTVPEGITDILSAIKSGIIENPNDPIYYNIPI